MPGCNLVRLCAHVSPFWFLCFCVYTAASVDVGAYPGVAGDVFSGARGKTGKLYPVLAYDGCHRLPHG